MGEGHLHVFMQDEDESKGWEAGIIVSFQVDMDGPYAFGVIELNGMDDYRRIYVPDEIARFLLDGPFSLDSRGLFSFEPKLDNPCPVASGIADDLAKAFEEGCKMSSLVQLNLRRYSAEVGPGRRRVSLAVSY